MKVLEFVYRGKQRRVIVERETETLITGYDIPSQGYRSFGKNVLSYPNVAVTDVTNTPLAQEQVATFQRLGCV
jgi:hypothetical protein